MGNFIFKQTRLYQEGVKALSDQFALMISKKQELNNLVTENNYEFIENQLETIYDDINCYELERQAAQDPNDFSRVSYFGQSVNDSLDCMIEEVKIAIDRRETLARYENKK